MELMELPPQELIKKSFGNRMRELREQKRISQEALADVCELDRTYIGGVERGERNLSLINIYRIAAGLDVSPSALLRDNFFIEFGMGLGNRQASKRSNRKQDPVSKQRRS